MENQESKCGTCRHSTYLGDGEYLCKNIESENYGVWTTYDEWCIDWESK